MNKVILIGRLTKDPELRFAPGTGNAVCKFTLAVNRPFKKDEADFISCKAFGKTGETIAQYLTKGREMALSGSIRTGSYDAQDGTKRYTTEVIVESIKFIGYGGNKQDNTSNSTSYSDNNFGFGEQQGFGDDITPVYDEDMPF